MEFQPEVQNAQNIALNNPLILTQILKQASIRLKTCRLVNSFWNDMVLSLPNTRLALDLNRKDEHSKISFLELCSSQEDAKLVKRITCLGRTMEDTFPPKLLQVCDKFGTRVQILELHISQEISLSSVHQALKNSCPNLKQLRISFSRFQTSTNLIPGEVIPAKQNLTIFKVSSKRITENLTSFIEVVINASPNLKEAILTWGFFPDLSNSKCLESLTIALDGVDQFRIVRVKDKLSDLSHMLSQISDQLIKLSFAYVKHDGPFDLDGTMDFEKIKFRFPTMKMSKLQTFRNLMTEVFRCDDLLQNVVHNLKSLTIGRAFSKSKSVDETLQKICPSKKNKLLPMPNMTNLTVVELHDPNLMERLVAAFPNLEKFKLKTFYPTDFCKKNSRMKLGVALKACRGWKALKHLEFGLPKYPKQFEDIIKALLKARKLFKQLKTFAIWRTLSFDEERSQDLSKKEMSLFKQLLLAMSGMEQVEIDGLYISKKSAESIIAFMALIEMSVDKFSVVKQASDDESDEGSISDDYDWHRESSIDFDFSNDSDEDSD